MSDTTEHWKRKLAELDEKIRKLEAELEANNNLKLKGSFEKSGLFEENGLDEKISYLNEWIDFNRKEKIKCEAKLKGAEEAAKPKETPVLEKDAAAFDLIFGSVGQEEPKSGASKAKPEIPAKEAPVKESGIRIWAIKPLIKDCQPALKYALPFALLLLVIASLFFMKPEITGHAVLSKEAEYNYSLNLKINESGNYTWDLGKPVNIKSIKASGSVAGNGSVKVYIEKGGKKYLIFDNENN